jgi:hypothetical protein
LHKHVAQVGYGHEETKTDEKEEERRRDLSEAMKSVYARHSAATKSQSAELTAHAASIKPSGGSGSGSGAWLYGFVGLLAVGLMAGGFFYSNYHKITKSHLI